MESKTNDQAVVLMLKYVSVTYPGPFLYLLKGLKANTQVIFYSLRHLFFLEFLVSTEQRIHMYILLTFNF